MRPGYLSLLAGGLYFLFIIQFQQDALARLGLNPFWTSWIVGATFVGGLIDLPVYFRRIPHLCEPDLSWLFGIRRPWSGVRARPQVQWVAVNVGGFLVPVLLSLNALLRLQELGVAWPPVAFIWAAVVLVSHRCSEVVAGRGVLMRPIWPGLVSAVLATWLLPGLAPLAAYPCGVLGVLVGADLLNLPGILRQGTPFLSIGGAGTFDGIVMTGLLACLLS